MVDNKHFQKKRMQKCGWIYSCELFLHKKQTYFTLFTLTPLSAISAKKHAMKKLECSVALCLALLHPQLKKNLKKKNLKKKSENESCLKLPELPRNHISRRWGSCHGQPDGWTDDDITQLQVESLLAGARRD